MELNLMKLFNILKFREKKAILSGWKFIQLCSVPVSVTVLWFIMHNGNVRTAQPFIANRCPAIETDRIRKQSRWKNHSKNEYSPRRSRHRHPDSTLNLNQIRENKKAREDSPEMHIEIPRLSEKRKFTREKFSHPTKKNPAFNTIRL